MKKLNIYILKSFLGPFVMTFFICIFVLLMQFLWRYLEDFVGKGLEGSVIAEIMLYATSNLVPLAIPLAMLIASIMTFGNLGESNELLAMKAAGISLLRILRPLIVFAFLLSGFAFYFANNVVPVTNVKLSALLYSVQKARPEIMIKAGAFSNDIDGFSIKVEEKDKKGTLHKVMIYDHRNNVGNKSVTIADSAYMNITSNKRYMVLTLFNGYAYTEDKSQNRRDRSYPLRKDRFSKETLLTPLEGMDFKKQDEERFKSNYKTISLKQLEHNADSLQNNVILKKQRDAVKLRYSYPLLKRISRMTLPDSLKIKTKNFHKMHDIDIDSLFNKFPERYQQMILTNAVDNSNSNLRSITATEDNISNLQVWINKHWIEWHRKFTLSFACIIFFFIGAPFGAIVRKGGMGMPLVVSILLFIFYYVIGMIAEKSAKEGSVDIWIAMWFSSILFLPGGIALTYQAAMDSSLFSLGKYIGFFNKLLSPFRKGGKENESSSSIS